jgi:hypothetical protein
MSLETPTTIDEATVIQTNILSSEHVQTGFTIHHAEDFERLNQLAICKYEEDPGYYLFYCDSNWNVLNDTYYDSKEQAIEQAELEFKGTAKTWVIAEN